ncbi:fibrillarin-like rRNA/tRNA 2'-O-methyltransferase [Halorutilales archaeon Cl-col2-1]
MRRNNIRWVEKGDDEYPATEGDRVSDEEMVESLRVWNPHDSKLAALLVKGYDDEVPLSPETKVLYLGAAAGTTPSYVADVTKVVYGVEIAPSPSQRLVEVAESRQNLMPVVADARKSEEYTPLVEKVDLLYQDVATRDQAEVAVENSKFLEDGGRLCMMVKARSEDVTADPEEVYDEVAESLEDAYEVEEIVDLEPFYSDHACILGRLRNTRDGDDNETET